MRNLAAGSSQYVACPNCRGAGVVIAVWRHIGEDTIVQPGIQPTTPANAASAQRSQASNDPATEAYEIGTPQQSNSPQQTPMHTPMMHTPAASEAGTSPRTTGFYATTQVESESQQADALPTLDRQAFHVNTRLPDGRPSLIVDPGSVGNLSGDSWAREVAKGAVRNGYKPSYEKACQTTKG